MNTVFNRLWAIMTPGPVRHAAQRGGGDQAAWSWTGVAAAGTSFAIAALAVHLSAVFRMRQA